MDELTPMDEIKAIVESKATEEPKTESVAVPIPIEEKPIGNITKENEFQRNMNEGLNAIVKEAYTNDEDFKEELTEKTKDAAKTYADVEKGRASLEKQNLDYHAELIKTQQELEQYKQADHKWDNQRSKRQFVYDGIKPIMEWIGVDDPMNIPLMIFLTVVLIVPFIILKPLTALILGANPENRAKQAKAWLWTLFALTMTAAVLLAILLPCKYFGYIS